MARPEKIQSRLRLIQYLNSEKKTRYCASKSEFEQVTNEKRHHWRKVIIQKYLNRRQGNRTGNDNDMNPDPGTILPAP